MLITATCVIYLHKYYQIKLFKYIETLEYTIQAKTQPHEVGIHITVLQNKPPLSGDQSVFWKYMRGHHGKTQL